MDDMLARIFASKAQAAALEERAEPYETIAQRAQSRRGERRSFRRALQHAAGGALVGEIKRASPSAGLIARDFEPAAIARSYDAAGVDAISVITESDHFLGELAFLDAVRAVTAKPLLRKDFLTTPYQIAQSAAYGADAVLLILAGVDERATHACMQEAARYDLDVLVEVHDLDELRRAVAAGARIVGVNNRNLRTFETDLGVSEYILPQIPPGIIAVSESGVASPRDVARLRAARAQAFLVGEALMRAHDRASFVRDLKSASSAPVESA